MRALALDPTTGDLALTAGRLTLVEGVEAIAQRLNGRLSLWAGSWFADTAQGVPYLTFMGQKGVAALAESAVRDAILTCPGVLALESFTFALSAQRHATVSFRARVDGGFVERSALVLGA